MTNAQTADIELLKALEERVQRNVCDVNGTVTRAEVDALDELRARVGKSWDGINQRWIALGDR